MRGSVCESLNPVRWVPARVRAGLRETVSRPCFVGTRWVRVVPWAVWRIDHEPAITSQMDPCIRIRRAAVRCHRLLRPLPDKLLPNQQQQQQQLQQWVWASGGVPLETLTQIRRWRTGTRRLGSLRVSLLLICVPLLAFLPINPFDFVFFLVGWIDSVFSMSSVCEGYLPNRYLIWPPRPVLDRCWSTGKLDEPKFASFICLMGTGEINFLTWKWNNCSDFHQLDRKLICQ